MNRAFRFTLRREHHGVIVAESEEAARAALNDGVVDEIDCSGGELDVSLCDASADDVDAADMNECLFTVTGASVGADEVQLAEEL